MSRRLFDVSQSIASIERSQIGRAGGGITGDDTGTIASGGAGKMTMR